MTIRGAAHAPAPLQHHYDDDATLDTPDPSPCVVCNKHFNTKRQFFKHLHGVHHYRGLKYVTKRKAENGPNIDSDDERDGRFIKWMRRDMQKHD
jgi:hypothetical protein